MSAVGAVAAALFKFVVVDPSLAPLPGGGYGETFGPVSAIRIPIYAVCGAVVLAGLIFAGVGAMWGKRSD